MSIDISPEVEARLTATARAEGMSVDGFLACLIEEREQVAEIIARTQGHVPCLSEEQVQAKIEQGFLQSERGEAVDGDTFTARLLDEVERKRHVG